MGRERRFTALRGATHIRHGNAAPFGLLVREGDRARLRARSAGVFYTFLPQTLPANGVFLWYGGAGVTHPASARYGKRSDPQGDLFGIDDVAPVKVTPGKAVNEHLGGGGVGGDGDIVLVAELGKVVQIGV